MHILVEPIHPASDCHFMRDCILQELWHVARCEDERLLNCNDYPMFIYPTGAATEDNQKAIIQLLKNNSGLFKFTRYEE